MKGHKLISSMAVAILLAGTTFAGIAPSIRAEELYSNDSVEGVIRRSSPIYRFRNMWAPGTPVQELHGQEYTFRADEGDEIRVNLDIDRRSRFSPILVLFHTDSNKQLAYSQESSFRYRIPRSGDYKLLVLAQDVNSSARYTLEVSGISGDRRNRDRDWNDQADRGNREQFLEDEFGLEPADCRTRRSLVRVRFDQDGDNSTYCARPTRTFPAGDYYYNSRTRDLESASVDNDRDRCRVTVGGVCISR